MIRWALCFFVFAFFSATAHGAVWPNTNSWSPTWEERYSQWVKANWRTDVFASDTLPNGRPNPYKGLRPDCADTVYSMRVLFASEHGLPFVILDPTGSGRKISNSMTRFDGSKSQPERVRRFLQFLYDVVSTKSLPNDTFPVAITPRYVRSGAVLLVTRANHHSWTVKDILPIGVPWLIFSSTTSATSSLTLQQRQSWPNPFWVFEGDMSPAGHAGFRNFRPVDYIGASVWNVPGYSEEQYRVPLAKWQKFAQDRLASRKESGEQQVKRLLATACESLKGRVGAVNDGLVYLKANSSRCMSFANYDNFSTPSRDQRFFDDLVALRMAYQDAASRSLPSDLRAQLQKIFPRIDRSAREETASMRAQGVDLRGTCATTYAPGRTIDLAEAKRRLFAGLMSNNPHDGLAERWGETRGPSALARRCQSWDQWSPDFSQSN